MSAAYARGITCPKCARPMRPWESREVVLDYCPSCKGLWFDAGELAQHLAGSQARVDEASLVPAEATGLSCPRCDGARLAHVRVDSVTLDLCPRCRGIFLDVGEVHELLGAIRRVEYAGDPALARLGNLALGLYIASTRLGERRSEHEGIH